MPWVAVASQSMGNSCLSKGASDCDGEDYFMTLKQLEQRSQQTESPSDYPGLQELDAMTWPSPIHVPCVLFVRPLDSFGSDPPL